MTDAERILQGAEQAPANDQQHSPGAGAPGGDAPAPGAPGLAGADAAAVEGDLGELVAVAAQRDEYLALAQRSQADFENYRKRVAREAAAAQDRGRAGLAKELLPALDNLDRALAGAAGDDPLLDGVRLVRAELSAAVALRSTPRTVSGSLRAAISTRPPYPATSTRAGRMRPPASR